jgi:molybdate transport system substrate-binding protein
MKRFSRSHRYGLWLVVLFASMLLSACGGQASAPAPTQAPAANTAAPVATVAATSAATEATADATTVAPTSPATADAPATAAPTGLTGELNVFAAASLTDAFNEIAANLKQANPDLTITYNFAGSNQLAEQINQGAPADVFASANRRQMEAAIEGGRVVSGTQQTFVRNRLVVIYPQDNPAQIQTLQDLAKPGVKIVFAAPAVPIGQYALEFLGKASATPEFGASFSQTVTANVVSYEENVRAVLSKVALGEADAGIVYTSDAATESETIEQLDIPDELNTIATYPIAPLSDSTNAEAAQAFVAYMLSPAAQQVLTKYGFIAPSQ